MDALKLNLYQNNMETLQNKKITIGSNEIRATKTFQGLSKIIKSVTLNRNNRKVIENGVNVALNIGIKQWKKQSNFLHRNEMIVEEIIELLK